MNRALSSKAVCPKGLSKNFRSDAGLFLTPVGVT